MNREQLEYGGMRFQTPFYVFDLDVLEKRIQEIKKKLPESVELCFAMKANPFVVRKLDQMTQRIEICSYGEYLICRDRGIAPEKMIISGVLKKKSELFQILDECSEKTIYTIESMQQYEQMMEWMEKNQKGIHVLLRLTSGNQFGMDQEMLETIIRLQMISPYLTIEGIHFFSGTQKRSVGEIEWELRMLDSYINQLKQKYGFEVKQLEYGPGLRVDYFDQKKGQNEKNREEEELERITDVFRELSPSYLLRLEMGRKLTADCGYYFTTVLDRKESNETRYCIVDGGIHQLHYDGQIRGMYQPPITVFPIREKGKESKWNICGSLCTVNDVLGTQVTLRQLQKNDIIVFEQTGAYSSTEGMALFLSHELPAVYAYSEESGWKTLRTQMQTSQWNTEGEEQNG